MKYTATLILLFCTCCSHLLSQSNFKRYREQKKYKLKVEDLMTLQKDGKTSWTVKTTLINRSKDTLFYFVTSNCEPSNFAVDTIALFVDFQPCETDKEIVVALPPKAHQITKLEISAVRPLTSSLTFKMYMLIFKAKKLSDNISHDELMRTHRMIVVASNQIKT
jgi:hypothetical protein